MTPVAWGMLRPRARSEEARRRGGEGPGGGAYASYDPVCGVVAVGPGAAGGGYGDEVAVAPEAVGVGEVFVDVAL